MVHREIAAAIAEVAPDRTAVVVQAGRAAQAHQVVAAVPTAATDKAEPAKAADHVRTVLVVAVAKADSRAARVTARPDAGHHAPKSPTYQTTSHRATSTQLYVAICSASTSPMPKPLRGTS